MSDDVKATLDDTRKQADVLAVIENSKRSGKGLRRFVGATRGKNTQIISYDAFDDSKPDTLPVSIVEFSQLTGVDSEKQIVDFLIIGYNDYSYTQASDPIKEHVNPAWPDDVQTMFRNTVRNYSKMMGVTIEAAVDVIKPGLDAKYPELVAK